MRHCLENQQSFGSLAGYSGGEEAGRGREGHNKTEMALLVILERQFSFP